MKKILNILVILFFLVSFVGIQINKHYSNGKLYSIAVYHKAKTCCATMHNCKTEKTASKKCTNKLNNSCSCKNITETLRLNSLFISEKFTLPNEPSTILFSYLYNDVIKIIFHSAYQKCISYFIPPPLSNNIYITYEILLC